MTNALRSHALLTCITLLAGCLVPSSAVAQDAREIVKRSEEVLKGKSSQGTFRMVIQTPEYTRTMEMQTWWQGTERSLIVITAPRREAGNKTLKVNNELWMFLRNTETTIKIPPSMMLQSWNGSDFTNDDLVRESSLVDDYTLTILGKEAIAGTDTWKVRLVPKQTTSVVWGSILHWVRTSDFLPVQSEYFDERDSLMRTMHYGDIRTVGGRKIPTTWTMVNNVESGHRTSFEILDIQFDTPISGRVFSLRELEKGPGR